MITEEEYRAETFRIAGFAMWTPLGSIFLNPFSSLKEAGPTYFIGYIIVSILLSIAGLYHLEKGRDILDKKDKDKWKKK